MNSTVSSSDSSDSIGDHQENSVAAIENSSLSSSSTATLSSVIQVGNDIDLITEILLCLPVKSLLIFKSMSKQWLHLITDRRFVIKHISRNRIPKTHGLFFEKLNPNSESVYDFILLDGSRIEEEVIFGTNPVVSTEGGHATLFKTLNFANSKQVVKFENGVHIIEKGVRNAQSCNGLLCCIKEIEVYRGEDKPRIYTSKTYIYNPTTRRYKILPPSPFRDVVRDDCCFKVCSISLAFDPIKSRHQYQVICIWNDVEKGWLLVSGDDDFLRNYYIKIYSSKTNSWRKVISSSVSPLYALPNSFPRSGVYWNGCLHWIATEYNIMQESSMYFDIAQGLVKPFPFPTTPDDDKSNAVYFGECGGHLYLIEVFASCNTNYNILDMETDYSGWKLMYKLDLETFVNAYPGFDSLPVDRTRLFYRMVLLLKEDEEESLSKLVVLVAGKRVISYDLKDLSITEIHTFTEYNVPAAARIGGLWGFIHHYIESLACV